MPCVNITTNTRSRNYLLLLYPDNADHVSILNYVKSSYQFLGVLHDKDFFDDGTEKKSHYHIFLTFKNAKWLSALSSELNLDSRFIQPVRNRITSLQYLVHYNEEKKFHYDFNSLFGSPKLKNELIYSIENVELSETDKVLLIIEFIENNASCLSVKDLSIYCANNNLWDVFRRSCSLFINILNECKSSYLENK